MHGGRVTIIGAGIVGVSSAAWLQRAGFDVTLVESGGVGEGASFGNAGNITGRRRASLSPVVSDSLRRMPTRRRSVRPGVVRVRRGCSQAEIERARISAEDSRAMHELHRGRSSYDVRRADRRPAALIDAAVSWTSGARNGARGSRSCAHARDPRRQDHRASAPRSPCGARVAPISRAGCSCRHGRLRIRKTRAHTRT